MSDRDLDVVVFGATGRTGRQVSAYLAARAPQTGVRWAAAARNTDKLRAILTEDGVHDAETLAADVSDPASLAAMAARTKVVLNLVGPYTLYGRPVVEACVAGGAHYADLTGEIPFAHDILGAFHERARDARVMLVQICGFEALPPDLAVALAVRTARERFDEPLAQVDLHVVMKSQDRLPRPSDGLSGGTFQSMAQVAGADDPSRVTDPAALIPDPVRAERVRALSPIGVAPRRRADGAVIAPMAPAAYINPAVIHRTAWLTGSDPLRYREGIVLSGSAATLPLRYAAAGALSATQAGFARLLTARPEVRSRIAGAMQRVLPGSGYGPAADRLDRWWWRMSLHGATASGREVFVEVDGDGHPGYLSTARMLGEAGMMIAETGATPERAGCITPAVALGTDSLARFDAAGLRFRAGV